MKRKRKEASPSPILDDSPKRTKVQAQRKFAQNSGIHSPIITPIRDLETANLPHTSILPEPVELLPMKRPNTEDFLTFLCFRGTPILPQNLQFFNTASIVTDGQVHEIKGDCPKNGPIDIAKCAGTSSDKPFIAFGVRKRADPIVISRQMEKKRRHALAIQALRRRYQEQKMAKIRALTISKLSEKTTNKTLVKTNTIQVTKKHNTLQKTKVIATKHVKVTTQTLKTKVKPRMCLRSFRGKFVQKELPFRRPLPDVKKVVRTSRNSNKSEGETVKSKTINKTKRLQTPTSPVNTTPVRPQIKRRILLPSTLVVNTKVKPRLRSTTVKKTVISRKQAQKRIKTTPNVKEAPTPEPKPVKKPVKKDDAKQESRKNSPEPSKRLTRQDSGLKPADKKELCKNIEVKKQIKVAETASKKMVKKNINIKKEVNVKTNTKELERNESTNTISEKKSSKDLKTVTVKKIVTRKSEEVKHTRSNLDDKNKAKKVTEVSSTAKLKQTRSRDSTPKEATEVQVEPEKKKKLTETKKEFNETENKKTNSEINKGSDIEKKKKPTESEKKKKLNENSKKSEAGKKKPADINKESDAEVIKEAEKKKKPTPKTTCETEMKKTEEINVKSAPEKDKKSTVKETPKAENNKPAEINKESETEKTKQSRYNRASSETEGKREPTAIEKESSETTSARKIILISNEVLITKEVAKKKLEEQESEEGNNKTTKLAKSDSAEETCVYKNVTKEETNGKAPSKLPKVMTKNNEDKSVSVEKQPHRSAEEPQKKNPNTVVEEAINKVAEAVPEKKAVIVAAAKQKSPLTEEIRKIQAVEPKQPIELDECPDKILDQIEILDEKITKEAAKKIEDCIESVISDSTAESSQIEKQSRKSESKRTRNLDRNIPVVPARPSRKTKEAAAIYMEILSHKLHDSIIDDDNQSIDSFPELPNVKRMEQREIELKAQATKKHPLDGDNSEQPLKVLKTKVTLGKRKSNPITVASDDDSDNEVLQAKIRKSDGQKVKPVEKSDSEEDLLSRRQAMRLNLNKDVDSDVIIPRKKTVTRHRGKAPPTEVDVIVLETKPVEESDSDESTTSDINLKSLQAKQRKKLSKTKPSVASFSDSDEEPLVKLAQSAKSTKSDEKPRKVVSPVSVMEPKPKRECTKRPSNYLPMLSSSDEEEYFPELTIQKEPPQAIPVAPSLEFLGKDMGRKGKVNMSNEQIEQWLKDSALAGSSVAKENDAMLKFGEKIPTECIEIEDIKPLKEDLKLVSIVEAKNDDDVKPKSEVKSPLLDRKWIFKKDKKEFMPNKNAFSPENECSVYAFGDDHDEVPSTPFRRPSRRPSSTATSRSEDEMSKTEDSLKLGQFRKPNPSDSEDSRCFPIPQNPTKYKTTKSDTMVPPSNYQPKRSKASMERFLEPFDDYKYKVPSSPSASSGSSSKLYRRGAQKPKGRSYEMINPVYVTDFPKPTDPAKVVEAPVFHPTEQEFHDPLEYIERIRHKAEQFGICKIILPKSFRPECKVSDDMRFTAYNQYVHKMLHRWGPNFKEFVAIKKYLSTQSISLKTPPLIGGMEIDLPRLYQTVQSLGGLKEVIEKKKWSRVSDSMKIPKSAQDRVTKLDDIYCKYLLPYDTLSPAEREKIFDEVETYWAKKESKLHCLDGKQRNEDSPSQDYYDSDDNETEECTVKGKNMALNGFYRIARNTMAMYFKVAEPTAIEVEQEFWRYVTQKQNHICVHSASIDCGTWGYGFPVSKNAPFARHPWNLKVLSNNSGSVLRSLGPVMGVTIPTLHVGMVFSACCWYRDPHGLPWVEYLHTGGNKIWYGVPTSSCEMFHAAMQKLVPNYCRDKELWLPSDTAMVPPSMLLEQNVSLCRTVQEPGQFIVVFPKVFTSSICAGYVLSESVYFAPLYWLKTAKSLFNDLKSSSEPSMFSLDKMFISIANDHRSTVEVLRVITPFLGEMITNEKNNRIKLRNFGKLDEEKISGAAAAAKKKKIQSVDGDSECEVCRMNLFVSMVIDTQTDLIYCLEDAIKLVEKDSSMMAKFKLKYSLDEGDLDNIPKRIEAIIEQKLQKKVPSKFAGLPTLLK